MDPPCSGLAFQEAVIEKSLINLLRLQQNYNKPDVLIVPD